MPFDAGKTLMGVGFLCLSAVVFLKYTHSIEFDYKSSLAMFSDRSPCAATPPPALKVYMYELPRRFHIGMIRKNDENVPVTAENLPPWPSHSGLKLQHSVEYWMMASLLYEGGGNEREEGREAVRVLDPETADVFFLPFFSSLSFNSHGHNMTDPDTEIDRQLQVDVLDVLRKSVYYNRSSGRDHVIPMHHPNAFRFHRDQLNASILIVADFGRYTSDLANLRKDVVAPYVHVVDTFKNDDTPDPFESRKTLLFFRGKTHRKDEGKIRGDLERLLFHKRDVIFEQSDVSGDGINASAHGMRSSKFCLHAAGDTPSSCRLFDAIVNHCVPVIVSDHIELPFEDELDYNEFSLFFSVEEALRKRFMVAELRKVSKERWLEMWRRLKAIAHHFEYQYPPRKEDAVNMIWRQVKNKLPEANLAVHRNRRLKIADWWTRQ